MNFMGREHEQRMEDNVSTSRNIFEKKKNMFARVKETKTRLVEQRRHDFYLPKRQLKSSTEIFKDDQSSLSSSYIEKIYSRDEKTQYSGLLELRKILIENPQQAFLQFDPETIPRIIEFLSYDHIPYFQLEAAWILSIIACNNIDKIRPILQNGVFPYLRKLLTSPKDEINKHIVAGIGNMAVQSTIFRDILLRWGMLDLLLDKVNKSKTIIIRKDIIRGISNLCRRNPLPDIRLVRVAIPTLCEIIKHETDEEIVLDTNWALADMVKDQTCINTIINSGATPALIRNLKHPELKLLFLSLRILGKLLMGSEEQTNKVLCDPEFLPSLANLLSHSNKTVRRGTCWVLSNIALNSNDDIAKIINTPQCLSKLFYICQNDEIDIKREAFWVWSNMALKAQSDQITLLLQNNLFNLFISNLDGPDGETIIVILKGLINILKREDLSFEDRQHFRLGDIKDGWEKIQEFRSSPDQEIHKKSFELAQVYDKRFAQILT